MKHPRPASASPVGRGRVTPDPRELVQAVDVDEAAEEDRSDERGGERPPSARLRQLAVKTRTALSHHQKQKEAQVKNANQELDAMAFASVRTVVLHALRHGISAHARSGEPHQVAVGEGAMLVAQALHRDGVLAAELTSLRELWRTRISAPELLVAAEQLLGQDFCRLPYDRGTPLSDLCEVLFGSAREAGDLIAAGAVVGSIHRKLELLESRGSQVLAPRPSKPFVRRYTASSGGSPGSKAGPG